MSEGGGEGEGKGERAFEEDGGRGRSMVGLLRYPILSTRMIWRGGGGGRILGRAEGSKMAVSSLHVNSKKGQTYVSLAWYKKDTI